jgi:tripartite-type tricarboxylate transporter receptor subunit TctC
MRTPLALLACALFSAAQARGYPSKAVRIIVPYAAGGTSDILARQLAPKLSDAWGQPVLVENKPGANGNVGADFVAKSAADGHMLLLTDLGGLVITANRTLRRSPWCRIRLTCSPCIRRCQSRM